MTLDAGDRLLATDLHVEATSRLMEALVELENRMRRRVELLSDAVIETDADGVLVFLNRAWQTLTGLDGRECLGRAPGDFFPDECRASVECVLSDHTGDHHELSTYLHHVDGRTVRVALTTSMIPAGGVVAVLRDITKEHDDQAELSKLSLVASSTRNLVIITDERGRIDWVNPAFEERTGYRLAEVQGRRPGSFLQGPGTDMEAVDRVRTAIRDGDPVNEELLNYTKSGDPYWVELNVTPVTGIDGRIERFISVQAETTERKRVERMKTQFVSTVSHELRTPLTAISGVIGLLAGGVAGPVPEEAKALLDIGQKNSERLTLLINDLLDMERLVEGGLPLDCRVQPLLPILQLAVDDNRPYAGTYDVRLTLTDTCGDVLVCVDRLRLVQVLTNLLSNSCKFAPVHTTVEVSTIRGDGCVRICVHDSGPGIPDEFRSSIFEKFSQADASDTRSRGGTGLGLAISKELVERMGGSIGFDTTLGVGTTFFIDLPVAPAAVAGSMTDPRQARLVGNCQDHQP